MKNGIKAVFPSLSRNEALARGVTAQFVMLLDPTLEELSDIRTAVSEAVTNAIVHGYGNDEGDVTLELCSQGRELEVKVTDKGRGIEDIELARRPFFTTGPGEERTGMGFAVMEAFMDTVLVESEKGKGTAVTMRKRLSGNG